MFQIASLDGSLRAFSPGEIRTRRNIKPIERATAASLITSPSTPLSMAAGRLRQGNPLLQRYQPEHTPEEPSELLFAREIMSTPVFTILPSTTLNAITTIFADRRYRHIPVMSEIGALIGIVSDRDVLRYKAATTSASQVSDRDPVSKIMTADILTASPVTLIREIARVMVEERIGAVPIVGASGGLEGLVTRGDIVRALITHGPIRLWA